jgi:predicted AlkP superfamily pyrophosphatase or phosphodiesterase
MRGVVAALALVLSVMLAHDLAGQDAHGLRPTVVLISFDGWRWDYDVKFPAPSFESVVARGVRAAALIPSFPTKTFPNHYTLVTGLYPGHHGVVANNIHDPDTGRRFSLSNRREVQDPMWWGGEPIWVRLQNAGQTAAAMFWPGSEAPILGQHPKYWMPYDETLPGDARVDRVLAWLELPREDRPTFLTLYFEDVDSAAHNSGPESRDVRDAVRRVDGYLGRLLRGLERRGIDDEVNIVITSDHGLAETSMDRVVVLDDYIDLDDVEIVDLNPTLGLLPKAGRADDVYKALAKAHPRMRVYRRQETPPHWHYRDHPRIPPIVGVVDEGWQVLRRATVAERAVRRLFGPRGEHGYDAGEAMSMRGVFAAAGPAFKRGASVAPFENVSVYNVLTEVLGVSPAPNDGDPALVRSLVNELP